MEKNQLYEAQVTGYTAEGFGVCRVEGMAVFVPQSARGDQGIIRITKLKNGYAFGIMEKLIKPSPYRIDPVCPVAEKCGGCDFQHISYQEELDLKRQRVLDALRRVGGVEIDNLTIIPSPEVCFYRNKAQFPVGKIAGRTVFGFYRSRSREIVPTERCYIQHEDCNAIAQAVALWCDKEGIEPFDQQTGTGFIRHIYVRTGEEGALLTLITNGTLPGAGTAERLVKAAKKACPRLLGVVLNINRDNTNRIMGDECLTLWGKDVLTDRMDGLQFVLSPLSFYQVNHPQAEAMYRHVVELAQLSKTKDALDLYCGVGTITLALAKYCRLAVGVEIVERAVRDAWANAQLNHMRNVRFLSGDAGQAAKRLAEEGFWPEVIVCDPPRKGLDQSAVDAVLTLRPKRVIFVSCDCATMSRDIKKTGGGVYDR